jgi:DNA-binding response OmpR family regulator
MTRRIHVIHPDARTRHLLRGALVRESHAVTESLPGTGVVADVVAHNADLVALALSAGRTADLETCSALRAATDTPLLAICYGGDQVIAALHHGADACIVAPFSLAEFVARVGALLRRSSLPPGTGSGRPPGDTETVGSLVLDRLARTAQVGNRNLRLGRKEFDLLSLLLAEHGRALPRDRLLSAVWGAGSDIGPKTLDVHIHQLRSKLAAAGDVPVRISTVTRVGYRLDRLDGRAR